MLVLKNFSDASLFPHKGCCVQDPIIFSRMVLVIARFRRQRSSATAISAWIHCCFSVNMLRMKRENMLLIQASYRQWKYHRLFLKMK